MSFIDKRTKIVATVGPACNNKEMLSKLIHAGADVFRLNFSHGSHDGHAQVIKYIRELNEELGTSVSILQDLQGPKIRIGEVENNGVEIHDGDQIIITSETMIGNAKKVSTVYEGLPKDVVKGDRILIDDGKLELIVDHVQGVEVTCTIKHGGILKSKKGINLPTANVSAPSLTDKDIEDLAFGLEQEVDWIALSFVRRAEDITDLRERIKRSGKDCRIIAKIEKPEAIRNIDSIIEATDAIMVARGDLGVEVPMEQVPLLQKMMVQKCIEAAKPVIIATQMMESMIENARPTRAETNDVGNSVLDGADAVMLSAETAAGKFPVETVQSMVKIIQYIEANADIYYKHRDMDPTHPTFLNNSVVQSACRLTRTTNAKAIVGNTMSGFTAFRIASHRPKCKIFIFTPSKRLLNKLNLVWGVKGVYYDKMSSTDHTFQDIQDTLKVNHEVKKGDVIINTASMPIEAKKRTNMLKVHIVD